nr:MAG TPA: protein of unknown function (DUF5502) [Caudoviricetes sp.]
MVQLILVGYLGKTKHLAFVTILLLVNMVIWK